ncbi:hypothetical protein [Cytobacillus praedii]|uniref:hypothetical protein n=1 Tax=Cytobacillus praedii TaxID=1742358 RepID=UPI002E21A9B9|nr:hypothetical protein [Cytobacillus praedii]
MTEFESLSFSRLFSNKNFEFFFILGINDKDDFNDVWDGRLIEVVGYAVVYINDEQTKHKKFIYLIDKVNRDFENIIRYTKKFIEQMYLSPIFSDSENFKILKTNIESAIVKPPYTSFIKSIVENEIPQTILDKILTEHR